MQSSFTFFHQVIVENAQKVLGHSFLFHQGEKLLRYSQNVLRLRCLISLLKSWLIMLRSNLSNNWQLYERISLYQYSVYCTRRAFSLECLSLMSHWRRLKGMASIYGSPCHIYTVQYLELLPESDYCMEQSGAYEVILLVVPVVLVPVTVYSLTLKCKMMTITMCVCLVRDS